MQRTEALGEEGAGVYYKRGVDFASYFPFRRYQIFVHKLVAQYVKLKTKCVGLFFSISRDLKNSKSSAGVW